jgi:carbon starvation protein
VGDYERLTQESLRGRTGGAVTLAVGMAHIFDGATRRFGAAAGTALDSMWKYWYHFAIMFEALFILTTIDTGTRIGRFLLQEVAGKIYEPFGRTAWWPGAIVSTVLVVMGWSWFMNSDSFNTIWLTFGIANQMLVVIALAIASAWLVNEGRARYLWATGGPLLVVLTTTGTAAAQVLAGLVDGIRTQLANPAGELRNKALFNSSLQAFLILALVISAAIVLLSSAARIWNRLSGEHASSQSLEPAMVR